MTQGFIGADPRSLDELAGAMARAADELEAARSQCSARLDRSGWAGGDADEFRRQWSTRLTGMLSTTARALTEQARVLRLHALEQRGASEDSYGLPPLLAGIGAWALDGLRALFGHGSGRTPAEVNALWNGLSAAERADAIREHPERIGALDGIPAADRDAANRIVLAREVAAARAELEQIRRFGWRDLVPGFIPGFVPGLGESEGERAARLNAVVRLEERLESSSDLYLLGFDNAGDGRAIVAVGNPDTADNVITLVPGVGSGMMQLDGKISHVEVLRNAAGCFDGPQTTATVVWVDYEAPDQLHQGIDPSYADNATGALDSFQTGLRASHEGEPSHNTIIGFSYGGKVVGTADREETLPVDDIVLIGNPQVGVGRAADLSVGEDHVWVSASPYDPVALVPGAAGLLPNVDDVPAEADFGGRRFTSDMELLIEAHFHYFDAGSSSLVNMALIGTGNGDKVR